MAKIKSICGKCKNNSPEGFTVFHNKEEVLKLIEKFPFYKVIKSASSVIGKTKRDYHLLKCDRLNTDGSCQQQPENAPAWCKVED